MTGYAQMLSVKSSGSDRGFESEGTGHGERSAELGLQLHLTERHWMGVHVRLVQGGWAGHSSCIVWSSQC